MDDLPSNNGSSASLEESLIMNYMASQLPKVVVFGPGSNCTLEICPLDWSVYKYQPSLPANATFLALFGLAMVMHIYLGIHWRSWWFMAFMISGCIFEMIGYGGRIMLYRNPFSFPGFLIQIITITGAPVFFTAAIYVTLSKTQVFLSLSRIRPKLFYYFLIPADIICLVLQAAGGAVSTVSRGVSQRGIDIAMVGLILQVAVLVIFIALFGDYMARYLRSQVTQRFTARETSFFICLALATVLILARCAYRCYELKEGYTHSELITNESLFIVLEGALVYISSLLLCIGHPGLIFHGTGCEKLEDDDVSGDQIPLEQFVYREPETEIGVAK
ncbi:unnamed protein product [Clonostachys rosea f. rosea IK726]|uniref:Parasitic phase-specific protein PSP-1 n=2 Tax=Bionectria ochroleuca TaxID=29856 RepID=A0A0B7K9Z3_BIOOC|nr:unnamed protein product [Clonostachys rosea f. rosea IK726]